MLNLLIRNRLNIILLGYTRDEPKKKAGRIIGTLIVIIIFSLILFYSTKLISLISNKLDMELANIIFDIALDYAFAIIFIFIIFTGIATSLYILYLSKDLELLLSLPISYRTVFTYKYIEALISNSYLFFIVIFPFLISYGITSKIPLAYYPLMIIIFIFTLSIPTSLGVLIGMIAARYVNPSRAREILAVVGGLFGMLIWLSFQIIPRYVENITPELKLMGIENIKQYIIAIFDKPFLRFLPSTWGSNTLFYIHNGDYREFIFNFTLITVTSILLIFLCIVLSQRIYYSGWSSTSQVIARKVLKKGKAEELKGTGEKKYGFSFFSGVNYIIVKDFKLLFRDARRLFRIFMPVAMLIFLFFWSFSSDINKRGNINFFIPLEILLFLFFPLLISGMVNTNISGNNIGGEGLKFWILKLSPVHAKKILRTKIIFSSVLTVICGSIIMIIFYFVYKPGLSYLIFGLLLLILFSWGDSVIGTSVGTFFPVFKPSQSNKDNVSFIGGILNLVLFFLYLLFFVGIIVGMLFLANYFSFPTLVVFPVILVLELIVNLILHNVLINLSAYRLNGIEWKY